MENHAEAQRHFKSLSIDEKLDELWFGMREIHSLSQGMIDRQDKTNGTVTKTADGLKEANKELAVHLEMHKMEQNEISFMKKWGSRGTGFLAVLVSVGTAVIVAADRIWGS